MHNYFLTWHGWYMNKLKDKIHNDINRIPEKLQLLLLKPIRMLYCNMLDMYTKQQDACQWQNYVPLRKINILCITGNICYDIVKNVQVLSYPFNIRPGIQK